MSIYAKSTIQDEAAMARGQNIFAKQVLTIYGDERSSKSSKLTLEISIDSSYSFQTRIKSSV